METTTNTGKKINSVEKLKRSIEKKWLSQLEILISAECDKTSRGTNKTKKSKNFS